MLRCASVLGAGALAVVLASCGAASVAPRALSAAPAKPMGSLRGGCPDVVRNELADIVRRIYAQAVDGRAVVSSVRRLQRSRALADAVARGDRAAVQAAFAPLRHQIVRIELSHAGRAIYRFGAQPSFAPIRGVLRGSDGRVAGTFVLAVTGRAAYAGIVKRLTGADVVFRTGGRAAVHAGVRTVTLPTRDYPSGPLRIDVRIPTPSAALCDASAQDTRANVIALAGRRLLRAESHSPGVAQTLRHTARDPAFRRATARDDRGAIRAAIIDSFFRDHSHHIVRVRVLRGHRLIYDLGGPYVLSPASGTVRSPDGRSAATFILAVQDDTGYIKLMHRFTGADVQLVSPLGRVPGSTLEPGPATIPDHGTIEFGGRRYIARSFDGAAFPSGQLRISLLVPQS